MRWFSDLKTGQKIGGLVLVMSILLGIVGITGFYFVSLLSNNLESMYDTNLMSVKLASSIRANTNANEADMYKLLATDNIARKKDLIISYNERLKENTKMFSAYEKIKLSQSEKEMLAGTVNDRTVFKSAFGKIMNLSLSGQDQQAAKVLASINDVLNNYRVTLKKLSVYNENQAEKMSQTSKRSADLAKEMILAVMIVSLLAGISIGSIISILISKPLALMLKDVEEVAKGNLAIEKIKIDSKDEIGQLSRAFNLMDENLRRLIKQVTLSIDEISSGSEEMNAACDQTVQGAQQVSTSIEQLAAGTGQVSQNLQDSAEYLTKINKAIQNVSKEAENVANLVGKTEINANEGRNHIKKAIDKIDSIRIVSEENSKTVNDLGKLSSEVGQIVDLIKSIAAQTNLLALNAAIEAARAGEHGKGFAVVADEVKKLATQSGEATDKITVMIKEIQSKTSLAVSSMDKSINEVHDGVIVINDTGKVLENIIDQVKLANSDIQGINTEIDDIAKNSDEIVQMIESISGVTEQTAASAQEITSIIEEQTASLEEIDASSQSLALIGETLEQEIMIFTT